MTFGQTIKAALGYAPIGAVLFIGGLMPYKMRAKVFGGLGSFALRHVAGLRRRVTGGLARVYPDMSAASQRELAAKVGRNAAQSLGEILFNDRYQKQSHLFHASGPGLDVLRTAKAEGRGAIVVSAHYGQWEAIRHVLKRDGLETGAVYRENGNAFYEQRFLTQIEHGGLPIVARGPSGNRAMIKHLRSGGFFAILVDQKYQSGEVIPFLGHDALTATAAADLAIRYDLPLVPAFGTRRDNGFDIDVEFEAPIERGDAVTMMAAINERIGARINAKPEQWYWLHKRWEHVELYDQLGGKKR